jgi:hypothetical protein
MSTDRRRFLQNSGLGFGALAANWMTLHDAARAARVNPLAAKRPPLPATAKSVIFLFMHGGPSHIDLFDPKPLLEKLHGAPPPDAFGDVQLQFSTFKKQPMLASRRKFGKYGRGGADISDLFPNLAQQADDIAIVRSMNHDGFTHTAALNWLNNGWPRLGRPSIGSWVVYGLGSECDNLPAFVVMLEGGIKSGPVVYHNGFLPAMYQGTTVRQGGSPILNLKPPAKPAQSEEKAFLELLQWNNEKHFAARADDSALEARMAAYELAFKMQVAAPDLADLSKETEATRKLYGLDNPASADFGTRCLLARRMVERGVRFIQIWSGNTTGGGDWDGHASCDAGHTRMAGKTDRPVAGLLADLKSRGLLDSTLVVWGGEFGRTPTSDGSANGGGDSMGRDHNPYGFTMWLAGGGVRGGKTIGRTDDIGLRVVEDPFHVHDLHASMLHLLGLDHTRLTYLFQGRDYRPTDVAGKIDLAEWLKRA